MEIREVGRRNGAHQRGMWTWQAAVLALAAALLFTAFLVGAKHWRPFQTQAAPNVPAPPALPAAAAGDFVYFPAQYVNQATHVEEHIEAF
jgi:hypothetical protein